MPTGFWSRWATAGIAVLGGLFSFYVLTLSWRGQIGPGTAGQIADGMYRFALFILSPLLLAGWLGAPWVVRRIGEAGYWRMLGLIGAIWVIMVAGVTLIMRG